LLLLRLLLLLLLLEVQQLLQLLQQLLLMLGMRLALLLRASLRPGLEGQHAAELGGDAADGVADLLVAGQAADQAAQGPAELADGIAEPALRRQLALLLLFLLLLLLLVQRQQLRQLLLLIGVGRQRQEAAADAARHLSDLPAKLRVAEQSADAAADQAAQRRAEHAAEESLWCQLLPELLPCLLSDSRLLKLIHDQLLVWIRPPYECAAALRYAAAGQTPAPLAAIVKDRPAAAAAKPVTPGEEGGRQLRGPLFFRWVLDRSRFLKFMKYPQDHHKTFMPCDGAEREAFAPMSCEASPMSCMASLQDRDWRLLVK
jgi:hypothetical protein